MCLFMGPKKLEIHLKEHGKEFGLQNNIGFTTYLKPLLAQSASLKVILIPMQCPLTKNGNSMKIHVPWGKSWQKI